MVKAVPEDFLVQAWNMDEGLPHSTVTSIVQTPDGYLWLGTLLCGESQFEGILLRNWVGVRPMMFLKVREKWNSSQK